MELVVKTTPSKKATHIIEVEKGPTMIKKDLKETRLLMFHCSSYSKQSYSLNGDICIHENKRKNKLSQNSKYHVWILELPSIMKPFSCQ